jgi:hypothetical protein
MRQRPFLRRLAAGARRCLRAGCAVAALACGRGEDGPSAPIGPSTGSAADAGPSPFSQVDDPTTCRACHASHYAQWSLGVHASAGDDPVFRAMNARGQRETGGALGDFCVRCHAPVALARGATADGTNLAEVPAALRGVTCVACHMAGAPDGSALDFTGDGVMRGPIADPVASPVHASVYSVFHDRTHVEAAALCGACHAVTNDHGLEVERTLDEWRTTSYAAPATLRTCGRCHMAETVAPASDLPGSPLRPVHDHAMPALDLGAGTPAELALVQQILDPTLQARLCVVPTDGGADVSVTIENALVGHDWPSGATQDRRAWIEIVAYEGNAMVQTSGLVPDNQPVIADGGSPPLVLTQSLFDDAGLPTLFMWNAASGRPVLLAPGTADPTNAAQTVSIHVAASVDRVTSSVRIRPVDLDVLGALVASGDLSADAGAPVTLTLGTTSLEWTADRGPACLP